MRINFEWNNCKFSADLTKEFVKNYGWAFYGTNSYLQIITYFGKCGISMSDVMNGVYTVRWNGAKWVGPRGSAVNLVSLLLDLLNTPLSSGKMYRFTYSGGTRAGQKRAAIVDEVNSDYILARDLDTNSIKNYSLSKMTDVEEIKV